MLKAVYVKVAVVEWFLAKSQLCMPSEPGRKIRKRSREGREWIVEQGCGTDISLRAATFHLESFRVNDIQWNMQGNMNSRAAGGNGEILCPAHTVYFLYTGWEGVVPYTT